MKIAIISLFFLSLFVRVWMLGNIPGMNGDEAWLGFKALQFIQGEPFSWKTNSGNFTNPFYLLPLAAVHAVFDGSFVLVRSIAVISGVLLLPLNFLLCRKLFDFHTALISTLLLAVLPINIMYSRFGWEPSQSVLASVPVMYCALWFTITRTRIVWAGISTMLCLAAALLVHPANFFLVCFPLLAFLYRAFRHVKPSMGVLGFVFGTGGGLAALGGLAYAFAPAFTKAEMAARLPQFPWAGDWIYFIGNYLRLFSGINSYRYIAGSLDTRSTLPGGQLVDFHWWDAVTALFFGGAILLVLLQTRGKETQDDEHTESHHSKDNVLLGFILASALLFFVLSGPARMGISYERYVLWMVAPGVLLLSRGAMLLHTRWPRIRFPLTTGGLLLCIAILLGFYQHYFRFMQTTGGRSEMAFRTAPVEPKLATAKHIFALATPQRQIVVLSSSWFAHWPMVYTARTQAAVPNVLFVLGEAVQSPQIARQLDQALADGNLLFAELGDTPTAIDIRRGLKAANLAFKEKTFSDYGGKPAVILLRPHARTTKAPQP